MSLYVNHPLCILHWLETTHLVERLANLRCKHVPGDRDLTEKWRNFVVISVTNGWGNQGRLPTTQSTQSLSPNLVFLKNPICGFSDLLLWCLAVCTALRRLTLRGIYQLPARLNSHLVTIVVVADGKRWELPGIHSLGNVNTGSMLDRKSQEKMSQGCKEIDKELSQECSSVNLSPPTHFGDQR